MRSLILSLIVPLSIVQFTGCGESQSNAPGLSRGGGGGNNFVQNNPTPRQNNNPKPSIDVNKFDTLTPDEPLEKANMPNESEGLVPAEPLQPAPTSDPDPKKVVESSDTEKLKEEQAIIEMLKAKGAKIRVIDGHAFSILLNKENDFDDTDCPDLAKLTELQFVGLSGANLTNAGLRRLTGLQNVTSIMLDNTQISDESVTYLQQMSRLAHISLANTKVTSEGQTQLAQAFPSALVSSSSATAPGESMAAMTPPGEPSGNPDDPTATGEEGEPTIFEPGSAEEAVQKIVLALKAGKAEGLSEFITKDAKKPLDKIRAGEIEGRRMEYYKQTFRSVQLYNKPRVVKGKYLIVLLNDKNQYLRFSCTKKKGDDFWKVAKLEIANKE